MDGLRRSPSRWRLSLYGPRFDSTHPLKHKHKTKISQRNPSPQQRADSQGLWVNLSEERAATFPEKPAFAGGGGCSWFKTPAEDATAGGSAHVCCGCCGWQGHVVRGQGPGGGVLVLCGVCSLSQCFLSLQRCPKERWAEPLSFVCCQWSEAQFHLGAGCLTLRWK